MIEYEIDSCKFEKSRLGSSSSYYQYLPELVQTENSACPATFVRGRLHNYLLSKNFIERKNWKFVLVMKTLRNVGPSRRSVKTNKQCGIPDLFILRLMLCVKITIKD